MSKLANRLIFSLDQQTQAVVNGTLTGSGSLSIPAGISSVTLTGRGGTGGDNSYYDPGQPYVAPSGYHAEIPAYYTYSLSLPPYIVSSGNGSGPAGSQPSPPATGSSPTWSGTWQEWNGSSWDFWGVGYNGDYHAGTAAYYDNPGQAAVTPSSGGGVYSGSATTATLNGVTKTWAGGVGGTASPSVQTAVSSSLGQSLTYSIASGGSLSYSY